jgi:hypothetical protein
VAVESIGEQRHPPANGKEPERDGDDALFSFLRGDPLDHETRGKERLPHKPDRQPFEEAGKAYQAMSAQQINQAALKGYLESVVPMTLRSLRPSTEDLEKAATSQREIHETMIRGFESGRGSDLATARGTVWGAFNAVTEWVDHTYPVLKSREVSKARQESALFGTYAEIKRRAYSEAVALIN